MDWDKVKTFYLVAEAGSFTKAADELNLSQSAISRQISSLEENLGQSLFHRHARGLILTEQGEALMRAAGEAYLRLERAENQLRDSKDVPSGELSVTTTVSFGSAWLVRHLPVFLEAYPQVKVNLLLSDVELDLAMRDADVAIRFHAPQQPHLIQRQLMTVHYHIYASPAYLDRFGTPLIPEDLDKHRVIAYGHEVPRPLRDLNWIQHAGNLEGVREPILAVNNIYGILQAVESGLGLAALPDYLVGGNDRLVRVMPDLSGPTFNTYFVYPEELRTLKRIAVFRDFLIDQVRLDQF